MFYDPAESRRIAIDGGVMAETEQLTVYHFCAMSQTSPGAMQYMDGTVVTTKDVSDAAQYMELKSAIREQMRPQLREDAGVILLSLTVVGHK